ncbi:hypothetical protein ACWDYH_38405 [Nocardia goodfellowii]
MLFEGAVARLSVPDLPSIAAGFQGSSGIMPGDQLLVRWANSLAHLHRVRYLEGMGERVDRRRGEVVALIGDWVWRHLETSPAAAARVGQAVDALAQSYVADELAFLMAEGGTALFPHASWCQASSRVTEWADLVIELHESRPRFPLNR